MKTANHLHSDSARPLARPGRRHLRRRDHPVRRPAARSSSTCPGTGRTPAHAARRRRGRPRRRRLAARATSSQADRHRPRRVGQERLHERRRRGHRHARRRTRRTTAASRSASTATSARSSRGSLGITTWHASRQLEGRVRPAGPDGQPGELLRRLRQGPPPRRRDHGRHDRHLQRRARRAGSARPTPRAPTPGPRPATSTRATTRRSTSATANQYQQWGDFGITLAGTVTNIDGIEVRAEVSRSGTGNQTNCQIQFELSYNNGTNFTTGATGVKLSTAIPLAASEAYQSLGSGTDTVEPRVVGDLRTDEHELPRAGPHDQALDGRLRRRDPPPDRPSPGARPV